MDTSLPADEPWRLAALNADDVLDSPSPAAISRVPALARQLFRVPMATVSLLDRDHEKVIAGAGWNMPEIERELSWCAEVMRGQEILLVPDTTQDARFAAHPFVTGPPYIRCYAGAPIRDETGRALGAVAIMDTEPHPWLAADVAALADLAALVQDVLTMRLAAVATRREQYEPTPDAESLRQDVQLWQAIFDNAQDAIIVVNDELRFTHINAAGCKLLGLSPAEMLTRRIADLFPAERQAAFMQSWQVFREQGWLRDELQIRTYDGSVHPFEYTAAANILPGRHLAVLHDISERKRAEANLREHNERFRLMVQNSTDMLTLVDASGTFLYASPSLMPLLGYHPDHIVGTNVFDYIHPDDVAGARQEFAALIDRPDGFATVTFRLRNAHGEWLWVESVGHNRLDDPILHAIVANTRDISAHRQIEAIAHESETRLHTLINNAPVVVFALDLQGVITFSEGKALSALGLRPGELVGQSVFELYPAASNIQTASRRALAGESLTTVTAVGEVVFETYYAPIRDQDGAISGAIGVSTDITTRKRIEKSLQDAHNLLTSIVENIPHVIFVKDATELRYMHINHAGEKLLGVSREDLIGKHTAGYFTASQAGAFAAQDHEVLESGRMLDIAQARVQSPQGLRTFHIKKIPIFDEAGAPASLLGIAEDVTDRIQAEEALRASEQRFRQIAESIQDVFWVNSLDGRECNYISPGYEKIWGRSCRSLLDNPGTWLDAVHADDREPLLAALENRKQGGAYNVVYRIVRPDGATRWIWDRAFPVRDAAGDVTHVAGLAQDITERTLAEVELREAKQEAEQAKTEAVRANRAKSEFLSRMSHELRTPLNAILGFTQLLELDPLDESQRDSVQHILSAGRHLLSLIDEVLDVTRIESGRLTLSIEPVPLVAVVRECLDLVGPLAAKRGIRLGHEIPESCTDWHVLADRQRLQQVLINLLSNAVKYNREQGRIRVSCGSLRDPARTDGRLRIEVADEGPGIPPDKRERLFMPFDRLGAEQSNVEGHGLGLSLSKHLVEIMGGAIGMESGVDRGSIFWIDLPRCESPETYLNANSITAAGNVATDQVGLTTILYIEDNLSNLKLLEGILAHRPQAKLLAVMQGQVGLEMAREHLPQLILLDLNLPDMHGGAVLRQLKADPLTRDIPVVVLSADATPSQIERMRAVGAHEYLTKPLDVQRFFAVLDATLSVSAAHPNSGAASKLP